MTENINNPQKMSASLSAPSSPTLPVVSPSLRSVAFLIHRARLIVITNPPIAYADELFVQACEVMITSL